MRDGGQIADGRDLGAFVPAVLDDYPLTPIEFRLYCRAVRRAGGGGVMFESLRSLAQAWGVSDSTLREARRLLVAAGLLREDGRTRTGQHRMVLTPEAEWADPADVDELRTGALRPEKRAGRRQTTRGRGDRNPAVASTAPRGPGDAPRGRGDRTPAVARHDEGSPSKGIPEGPPTTGARREEEGPIHQKVLEQLPPDDRHRLAADPALDALVGALAQLDVAGWPPEAAAAALVHCGPLEDARSVARVLTARARQLADTVPPAVDEHPSRGAPDPACRTCAGTGWAPADDGVTRCACPDRAVA